MSAIRSYRRNLDPEAVKRAWAKDIRQSLFALMLFRRIERRKAREKVMRYLQSVKGNKKVLSCAIAESTGVAVRRGSVTRFLNDL